MPPAECHMRGAGLLLLPSNVLLQRAPRTPATAVAQACTHASAFNLSISAASVRLAKLIPDLLDQLDIITGSGGCC